MKVAKAKERVLRLLAKLGKHGASSEEQDTSARTAERLVREHCRRPRPDASEPRAERDGPYAHRRGSSSLEGGRAGGRRESPEAVRVLLRPHLGEDVEQERERALRGEPDAEPPQGATAILSRGDDGRRGASH